MYVRKRVLELPLLPAKITVTEANLYLLQSWNRYQQWLDTYSLSLPQAGVSGRAAEKLEGKSLMVAVVVHPCWGGCQAMA